MGRKPRIAVILDEDTSGDASRYESPKGLFSALRDAGGLPFGIPYLPEIVAAVVEEFDGLVCGGGRFAYPDEWYVGDEVSRAPPSDRLACRLWSDVRTSSATVLDHDRRGHLHRVTLVSDTKLAASIGKPNLLVNTLHREAVGNLSPSVIVSARSDDGVIEAIEIPSRTFALGLQWHQELFQGTDHPGNRVFHTFVEACLRSTRERRPSGA
jgi:putative glutamine amidotransferase